MPNDIAVRYADTSSEDAIRDDARALFNLLLHCHQEVGVPERIAPMDPVKFLQSIVEAVREGLVLMAYDGDELIGALGCLQHEIWYSQATMLCERFFYILPEYRDGEAFRAIIAEAKAVADALGIAISISIANMQKGHRPARNGLQRVAMQLTYLPQGNNYVIVPAGEDSNV